MNKWNRSGFTLIELSIVLVIIGLIVGGILVGQDMIKAAQIRSTVAQMEKVETAINTFRTKYNGLPGDLKYTDAQSLGLFTFSGANAGNPGFGDGNGQINGAVGAMNCSQEALAFWRHLGEANLIDGQFGITGNAALDADGNSTGNMSSANMASLIPLAKLPERNYFTALYGNAGPNYPMITTGNYLQLFGMASVNAGGTGCLGAFTMTPIEAYAIDSKIDDGKPRGGNVYAIVFDWAPGPPTIGNCDYGGSWIGDVANVYDLDPSAGANTGACLLRFRY